MRARCALAAACAVTLLAARGVAAPVTYTLAPASALGGALSASFEVDVQVRVNGVPGAVPLDLSALAPLAAAPTGAVLADWGSPGWDADLLVGAGDLAVEAAEPGNASSSAFLSGDQFPFFAEVRIHEIALGLVSDFDAALLPQESVPGSGPWSGAAPVDVLIGAAFSWSVQPPDGALLQSAVLAIPPSVLVDVPIDATLRRTGAAPVGNGTALEFPVPDLAASLASQPVMMGSGSCLVQILETCVYEIVSFQARLTSLTLADVDAALVATSPVTVPEPDAALASCAALLALSWRGRR